MSERTSRIPRQRRPSFPGSHAARPQAEYRPAAKLARRVALVTAAHTGAARAAAVLFAREGADLALVFPRAEEEAAGEVQEEVQLSGGRCLLLPGDTLDEEFCRRAVEQTLSRLGRLDILVNGSLRVSVEGSPRSGSNGAASGKVAERLSFHLFRSLQMVTAAVEHLAPGSAVINTGPSTPPPRPVPEGGDEPAREAVRAFTRSLAGALAPVGIRVNCVDPESPIWTPGPTPSPAALAPTFVYLAANPDSLHVTGEVLTVRG